MSICGLTTTGIPNRNHLSVEKNRKTDAWARSTENGVSGEVDKNCTFNRANWPFCVSASVLRRTLEEAITLERTARDNRLYRVMLEASHDCAALRAIAFCAVALTKACRSVANRLVAAWKPLPVNSSNGRWILLCPASFCKAPLLLLSCSIQERAKGREIKGSEFWLRRSNLV